jgi:hypothetical protein
METISNVMDDIRKEENFNDFEKGGMHLINTITTMIVSKPEDLKISISRGQETTVFEINPNERDLGIIIGSKGKTIEAIRRIIYTYATKKGKKAIIEIIGDKKNHNKEKHGGYGYQQN